MKTFSFAFAVLIATASLSAAQFTHGPIVGRPGATEMTIWARTDAPTEWRVRYGTSETQLDQTSATTWAEIEHDLTGTVALHGLRPDTRYYYALELIDADGKSSRATAIRGSFRTWPDADAVRHAETNPRGLFNFTFDVGSCSDQSYRGPGPERTALAAAWSADPTLPLFAIHHGDWIYEDHREHRAADWQRDHPGVATPRILDVAPALAGVWRNYRLYLERSAPLARWHAHVPTFFMFDDHEMLNDIDGTGVPGHRSRPAAFRDIGLRAWRDYLGWANPTPWPDDLHFGRSEVTAGGNLLHDPAADFRALSIDAATLIVHWGLPTDGVLDPKLDLADAGRANSRVYAIEEIIDPRTLRVSPAFAQTGTEHYSIGARHHYDFRVANCHFFVLDVRGHRSSSDLSARRRDDPSVSMLGAAQLAWLKAAMRASDADFLFVVSPVNFMFGHTGKGGFVAQTRPSDEAWPGFLRERDGLLDFFSGLGRPVLILSGDLHNSFSARVDESVWEFGCSPLNSGNHDLASEDNRPIQGRYDSFGRECEIRWSSFFRNDVPGALRHRPLFTRIRVNNIFENPTAPGHPRAVAYPRPQVIVQFFDGLTGELLYAEPVLK